MRHELANFAGTPQFFAENPMNLSAPCDRQSARFQQVIDLIDKTASQIDDRSFPAGTGQWLDNTLRRPDKRPSAAVHRPYAHPPFHQLTLDQQSRVNGKPAPGVTSPYTLAVAQP